MTEHVSPIGKLIYEDNDAEGPVCVYENTQFRYLTFGNQTEQSCLDRAKPHRLEHAYTQGMMLGLLFKPDCQSALLLGLGGGSLVRALRHFRKKMQITAVEYRPLVVDVAKRYFYLPEDNGISLHCQDAYQFIQSEVDGYDLIFSDLYLPEGMDEVQIKESFLSQCYHQLSNDGVLVMNLWSHDFNQTKIAQDILQQVFEQRVLSFHVPGGNDIAFAFRGEIPHLDKKSFIESALKISLQLETPLQNMARSFWINNAQKLHLLRVNRNYAK